MSATDPPAIDRTLLVRRGQSIDELRARRGFNRATIAVANKNARIIWAVLHSGEAYRSAA